MMPSRPEIMSAYGFEVDEMTVGQQLIVAVTVQNYLNEAKPYAAVIDIRDSDGITEVRSWQEGKISSNGSMPTGMSWVPQKADIYQARAFVVSGIQNPFPYSNIASLDIKVSER